MNQRDIDAMIASCEEREIDRYLDRLDDDGDQYFLCGKRVTRREWEEHEVLSFYGPNGGW